MGLFIFITSRRTLPCIQLTCQVLYYIYAAYTVPFCFIHFPKARGGEAGLRHFATSRKVAGSISDGVTENFH
jgi:hypothetical protein